MSEEPITIEEQLHLTFLERLQNVQEALKFTDNPAAHADVAVDFVGAFFCQHVRYLQADPSRMAPESSAVADLRALLTSQGMTQTADQDLVLAQIVTCEWDHFGRGVYRRTEVDLAAASIPDDPVKPTFVSTYEAQMAALKLTTGDAQRHLFALADINVAVLVQEIQTLQAAPSTLAPISDAYDDLVALLASFGVTQAEDQDGDVAQSVVCIRKDLQYLFTILDVWIDGEGV